MSRWTRAPWLFLPALAALLVGGAARAEGRRALLVGVSRHAPGVRRGPAGWAELRGPQNDVVALRDVLVARYGFRPEDVVLLQDEAATREAILSAFRRVLVAGASPGDLGVFYFAGHGSRVRNSLSPEPEHLDETIVPHDGRDIRDKEIARLLGEAAARKVRITAIFDSCHSGSIARGIGAPRAVRALPPDDGADARDALPAPPPTRTGALVVGGARADQSAEETIDDDGRAHGAFTAALLAVLRTAPLQTEAEAIFLRTRARLAASGASQEPVLDGPAERLRSPPFGLAARGRQGGALVPAVPGRDGTVELLAGAAIGLAPGAILARTTAPRVRLRVEEVRGLSRAVARPAAADRDVAVAAGDLFEVERWAVPARAAVHVHLGAAVSGEEVRRAGEALAPLRSSKRFHWVEDPSRLAPTHVVFRAQDGWVLRLPDGTEETLGTDPSAAEISRRLERAAGVPGRAAPCDARPCLFVRLPAPAQLAAALATGSRADGATARVESERDALYLLAGRIGPSGRAEYAWVLTPAPGARTGAAPDPLPRRSEWHPVADAAHAARSLDDAAARIARIRAWLTLDPPDEAEPFPYRLAFRRQGESALLGAGATLRGGATYEPVLVARPADLASGSPVRHVYVLVIDSDGRVSVLFPSDRVSVDVRFPAVEPGAAVPVEIPLGARGLFRVGEPFGTDTYVLLATSEPIDALGRLEQEAVTRGEQRGTGDPLTDLLASAGRIRGGGATVPGGWSVQRLTVTSAR